MKLREFLKVLHEDEMVIVLVLDDNTIQVDRHEISEPQQPSAADEKYLDLTICDSGVWTYVTMIAVNVKEGK